MYIGSSRKQKGFSLIEIVISLVLFSLLIMAILPMYISSMSLIFTMGQKTKVSNEAQAFIEAVYNKGIGKLCDIAEMYGSTKVDDPAKMDDSLYKADSEDKQIFHNVTTSSNMNKLTVMIFYNKGKNVVKLSALIP